MCVLICACMCICGCTCSLAHTIMYSCLFTCSSKLGEKDKARSDSQENCHYVQNILKYNRFSSQSVTDSGLTPIPIRPWRMEPLSWNLMEFFSLAKPCPHRCPETKSQPHVKSAHPFLHSGRAEALLAQQWPPSTRCEYFTTRPSIMDGNRESFLQPVNPASSLSSQ